jgi:two-component system response regulator RegA
MTKKVLIIDDDEVLRYSMSRALTRLGYEVLEAESLKTTQQVFDHTEVDWVVLDLRLGHESGLALAHWILTHHEQVRIVIITGYAAISTAVEAIKLGVKDYLIKPVSVEDIVRAFESKEIDTQKPIKKQRLSTKRLEWEHIQKVLLEHDGNISHAAKALNMHRRTLQRKLQKKPVKE